MEETKKQEKIQKATSITLAEGEIYTGDLSDGDKFHLLTQYLNNQGAMIKGILQLVAEMQQQFRLLIESQGIDYNKARNDLAKRVLGEMQQTLDAQKEEIKKQIKESTKQNNKA